MFKSFTLVAGTLCFCSLVPDMSAEGMRNPIGNRRTVKSIVMNSSQAGSAGLVIVNLDEVRGTAARKARNLFRRCDLNRLKKLLYDKDGEVFGESERERWKKLFIRHIHDPKYNSVIQLATTFAAGEGETELVQCVLKSNPNISCDKCIAGSMERTMIHEAAEKDQVEMLKLIRSLRPESNFGFNVYMEESPLSGALTAGSNNSAEWLIDFNQETGRDIGLKDLSRSDYMRDLLELAENSGSSKVVAAIKNANGM